MKFLGLILLALISLHFCDEVSANKLKILVPMYIYPSSYDGSLEAWKKLVTLSKKVPIIAIINPSSGPGPEDQPNIDYVAALKLLKKGNVKTIGYVSTKYTHRSQQLIEEDIRKYANWDPEIRVDGIFFDEVNNTATKKSIEFYTKIANYVKKTKLGRRAIIALNQGTNFAKEYLKIGNIGVTSEMGFNEFKTFSVAPKITPIDRSKLSIMIHTCSNEQDMKTVIDKAVAAKVGYVYVTDDIYDPKDNTTNPWNNFPTYFDKEVEYIRQKNIKLI